MAIVLLGPHTPAALAATPSISAGGSHSMALRLDGGIRAWGLDDNGQLGLGRPVSSVLPAPVDGGHAFIRVAAGASHSVGLKADGTVWAWGNNEYYQLGDGTTTNRTTPGRVGNLTGVVAISTLEDHTFALRGDGLVWGWGGRNIYSEVGNRRAYVAVTTPLLLDGLVEIVAIAAGSTHSAVLKRDGTVLQWGLVPGTADVQLVPTLVPGLTGVTAISAGSGHLAALKADGTVWAYGYNRFGTLGDGTTTNRVTPARVPGVSGIRSIASGYYTIFAIGTNGSVWGWGYNAQGQLCDGTTSDRLAAVAIPGLTGAVAVVSNFYGNGAESNGHTLALRADSTVVACGSNAYGELGSGSLAPRASPGLVPGLSGVVSIAAGGIHSMTVRNDGRAHAWGSNAKGQLGVGSLLRRSVPSIPTRITNVIAISAGAGTFDGNAGLSGHSLALTGDGVPWSWGNNSSGQLGTNSTTSSSTPAPISGLTGIVAVSAGNDYSLALRNDGRMYAWGQDSGIGNLGETDPPSFDLLRLSPRLVSGITGVTAISAGNGHFPHTLALKSDGTVWVWGDGQHGQLGDGTTDRRRSTPGVVPGLSGVTAISAGGSHSLALSSDGSVWAWGNNDRGQLGDGTQILRSRPVRVTGLSGVVAVSAGESFSLALKSDGTVWRWGNSPTERSFVTPMTIPNQVQGISNVAAISAGASHYLVLLRDGSIRALGFNGSGQLGDGTLVTRFGDLVVVLREDGAGTVQGNDWYLDLDPTQPTTIPSDRTPVFLLVATSPSDTEVSADIRFRAQDIGTTGSVYVFALAPRDIVRPAASLEDPLVVGKALRSDGAKADDVPCVLAQLTATGQLQAVSASSLQAYVTGVLSGQGASVSVINGVPTANIGGATFFVGYGTSGPSMINGGLNRGVISVPGQVECKPQAPKAGWWWDPPTAALGRSPRDGTGYSIEVQGSLIFFAAFLYDDTGRSNWYVATGRTSLEGSLFTGDLLAVRGGQTLSGAYKPPASVTTVGPITLAFNTSTTGTMVWPGGTVPLGRFEIVPDGLTAPPQSGVPESGWWWNPAESGRGFFIEWQNGYVDIAGYMYDDAGNPVWYLTVVPTPEPRKIAGTWWSFANGMTLLGPWKPNTRINGNVAPLSIDFTSNTTAVLTLPGGRTTNLTRHRF